MKAAVMTSIIITNSAMAPFQGKSFIGATLKSTLVYAAYIAIDNNQPASELITSVYRYKNAASVQAVKKLVEFDLPGTLSRAVFTYSGTVKMGFDLSDIAIEVDDATKVITITLPPFDIISSEIDMDSFEFVLEDQSIFNPIDPSEYTGALSKLKQEANTQARNDEDFMRQAKLNAQTVLESFLRSAGIEESYTVEFKFRGDN